jgi:hypothetical protein
VIGSVAITVFPVTALAWRRKTEREMAKEGEGVSEVLAWLSQ